MSSSTAAAMPHYREEDGQRVMKQREITVRVDLHRGTATGHGLDLRPVATTTSASTPTTAVRMQAAEPRLGRAGRPA